MNPPDRPSTPFRLTPYAAVFFLILIVAVAFSRGARLARDFFRNAGYVGLNNVFTEPTDPNKESAMKSFESALYLDNRDEASFHGLALLYALQGNELAAIESWANGGISTGYLMPFGENAQLARNYDEALRWYDRAINLEPTNGDAWYLRGQALAQLGQWEDAITSYRHALENPTIFLNDAASSDILCSIGWTYHWLSKPQNPQKALESYLLAFDNANFSSIDQEADCLYKQAELYLWHLGMPENAIQSYEAVLQRQPEHVLAASAQIVADHQIHNDFQKTEGQFLALIARFPDETWGYSRLGDLYSAVGDDDKAVQAYRKALLVAPGDTQISKRLESLTGSESDVE